MEKSGEKEETIQTGGDQRTREDTRREEITSSLRRGDIRQTR